MIGALAEKEESVGLLQIDLEKKEQKIVTIAGALARKEASIGLLQAKVNILLCSYSYRVGKIVIFPLRIGKKIFLKLKSFSWPKDPLRRIQAGLVTIRSYKRKISVAGQIELDFGRHRSGLQYGLQYLLGLHHPDGVVLDAFIERTFCWQPYENRSYDKPWIGFIHVPPHLPEWFLSHQSNTAIFKSEQ